MSERKAMWVEVAGQARTVDREGHRQLPRRVVELVLEGALARLVLGLHTRRELVKLSAK